MKRIGVSADAGLFERFKARCKLRNVSASSVISQFMVVYLGEYSNITGSIDTDSRLAALEIRFEELEKDFNEFRCITSNASDDNQ